MVASRFPPAKRWRERRGRRVSPTTDRTYNQVPARAPQCRHNQGVAVDHHLALDRADGQQLDHAVGLDCSHFLAPFPAAPPPKNALALRPQSRTIAIPPIERTSARGKSCAPLVSAARRAITALGAEKSAANSLSLSVRTPSKR